MSVLTSSSSSTVFEGSKSFFGSLTEFTLFTVIFLSSHLGSILRSTLREAPIRSDTYAYIVLFRRARTSSDWSLERTSLGYGLFVKFVSLFVTTEIHFLFTVALVQSILLATWVYVLSKILYLTRTRMAVFAILVSIVCTFSPIHISYSDNIIRAALALHIGLLAVLFLSWQRTFLSFVFLIISSLFHMLMGVIILMAFFGKFVSRKALHTIILVGLIGYSTGLSRALQNIVPSVILNDLKEVSSRIAYISSYDSGFRIDFLSLTLILIALVVLVEHKTYLKTAESYVLRAILGMSIPFLYIGYESYSDRWISPFWFVSSITLLGILVQKVNINLFGVLIAVFTSITLNIVLITGLSF